MLTLVAVIAIICEALLRPSAAWFVVIAAASQCCVIFAVLAAIYGSGSVRAFWLGFAIASLGQLGMEKLAKDERIPSRQIDTLVLEAIHPGTPTLPGNPPGFPGNAASRSWFSLTAFWIWPLLFGFAGGLVARRLYAARQGQGHR